MITTGQLRSLNRAGVSLGVEDVEEWVDAITVASSSGVLRLGENTAQLIDKVLLAWASKSFAYFTVYEYTYGEHPTPWLDGDSFKNRALGSSMFIRLPMGHPVKAVYSAGHVKSVHALALPGEYSIDVTDSMAALFPTGISHNITAIYAILTSSEGNWSRESWRNYQLLQGERGFISGIDKLTLAEVSGEDVLKFCDEGILGALTVPVIEDVQGEDAVESIVDSVENTRCVLIAKGGNTVCAMYCSRVRTGEIIGVRAGSGLASNDLIYLDLDSGDTVTVEDLLSLRDLNEGDEVFYVEASEDGYILSDEFGNFLL